MDCCMSGRHHHTQAVNSLGKGNPSWAVLGNVGTSQHSEQAKHKPGCSMALLGMS